MQPVYYLPGHDGRQNLTPEELAEYGLNYALDRPTFARVQHGPSDQHDEQPGPPGLVVCHAGGSGLPPRYKPELQTWRRLPGDKGAWVGIYNDEPPTPRELARDNQLNGYLVTLADGGTWHVPCARRWFEPEDGEPFVGCVLPQLLDFDADAGGWGGGGVKPRYRRLWQLVEAYTEAVGEALDAHGDDPRTEVRFAFDQLDELAVGALRVNYRVGPVELALLGAYDEESRRAIIDHVLDGPAWRELVKKKLSAIAPGAGGG